MTTRIKLTRIDNRLLHATVALNWNRFVNANYILIVDPQHINDPFMEKIMQLSLPKTMKVMTCSIEKLLVFLTEDVPMNRNVILLFKDLETAKEAVEKGFYFPEIQIPYPASRMMMKKLTDYFNEKEVANIRFIQEKGIKFYFQTAPLDTKDFTIFKPKK